MPNQVSENQGKIAKGNINEEYYPPGNDVNFL
mgnify:CR=1 FL=1